MKINQLFAADQIRHNSKFNPFNSTENAQKHCKDKDAVWMYEEDKRHNDFSL